MSSKIETYTKLYLDYLNSTIDYGQGERTVARHPKNWERVKSKLTLTDSPIINSAYLRFHSDHVYVWSDQHFGHSNVIRFCDRPFENVEEMDATLLENYNNTINDDDVCIWVGDVGFSSTTRINEILDQCNGYKVLVAGNHDFSKKNLRGLNFDEIHLLITFKHGDLDYLFTHYPIPNLPLKLVNIHGHIHNGSSPSENHTNVSVEAINYKPIALMELLK